MPRSRLSPCLILVSSLERKTHAGSISLGCGMGLAVLAHPVGALPPKWLSLPALPAELAGTLQLQAVSMKALPLLAHHPKLPPLAAFCLACKPDQEARTCHGELVVEADSCAVLFQVVHTSTGEAALLSYFGPLNMSCRTTLSGLGSWGSATERPPALAWGALGPT